MDLNLKNYFDNTKFVCMTITLSLILTIFFVLIPFNIYKPFAIVIKLLIIYILGVALFNNTQNTQKVVKNFKNLLDNVDFEPIRTNMIMSYVLSFVLLILILYVIKSIFH